MFSVPSRACHPADRHQEDENLLSETIPRDQKRDWWFVLTVVVLDLLKNTMSTNY